MAEPKLTSVGMPQFPEHKRRAVKEQWERERKTRREREQQEFEIYELLGAVFYLGACAGCGKSEKLAACDAEEAASGFYEKGWRVKDEKAYCRKCNKSACGHGVGESCPECVQGV